MKSHNLLIGLVVILGMVGQLHSADPSAIQWLGYCSQETNREQASIFSPIDLSPTQQGNFCVVFSSQPFEPIMGGYSDDSKEKSLPWDPATMLFVSVDLQKLKMQKDRVLMLTLNQKIPMCEDCDSSCWKLKKIETVSKSISLSPTDNRVTIDIGKIVSTWNLMGIQVKATVVENEKVIGESTFERDGWSWCE